MTVYVITPITVTAVLVWCNYSALRGFDRQFFNEAGTALLASATTSFCLWAAWLMRA